MILKLIIIIAMAIVGMFGITENVAFGAEDQSTWKEAAQETRVGLDGAIPLIQRDCSDFEESFSSVPDFKSLIAKSHLEEAKVSYQYICDQADVIKSKLDLGIQLEIDGKYLDAFEVYMDTLSSSSDLLTSKTNSFSDSINLAFAAEESLQQREVKIAQLEVEQQERIAQLEVKEKGMQELVTMLENMIDDGHTQVSQMEKSLSGLEYQSDEANAELDNAWKFKTKALYNYEIVISTGTILKDLANEGNFEKLQKQLSDPKFSEKSKNAAIGLEENMKNVYSSIDKANSIESVYLLKQEEEKGGCLIATATYGSEMALEVQQLRELRDNQLLQTESGTAFMSTFNDIYYSFSPIIADYERENPLFKEIVKLAITPMISTLSLMENAETESEVLSIGISVIMLNLGMYFGIPAIVIVGIKKKF